MPGLFFAAIAITTPALVLQVRDLVEHQFGSYPQLELIHTVKADRLFFQALGKMCRSSNRQWRIMHVEPMLDPAY